MRRFMVEYKFRGRGSELIHAQSLAEAQQRVDRQCEDENFDPPMDELDDIDARVTEMHPVTRDGKEIWTTFLRSNDIRGHATALAETPLFGEPSP